MPVLFTVKIDGGLDASQLVIDDRALHVGAVVLQYLLLCDAVGVVIGGFLHLFVRIILIVGAEIRRRQQIAKFGEDQGTVLNKS